MKTLKKVVFIGILLLGCWLQATAQTATVKWKYQDAVGNGNGYAESIGDSYIANIKYDPIVCEGNTLTMNVFMGGGQLFNYEWYEVGKSLPVAVGYFHKLVNCSYTDDNGRRFYCKVKDLQSGKELVSTDTVVVRVEKAPASSILPARDTTLCYGETLRLSVAANDDYIYQWSGGLIQGETNEPVALAAPDKTSTYTVTIMNGSCTYKTQRKVNVLKPEVTLPMDNIYAEGDGLLTLTPEKSVGSKLNWTVGADQYTNRDALTCTFTNIQTVKVTAVEGRCSQSDSCVVIPDKAFGRYKGDGNDGFAETKQKMFPGEISWSKQVCEGGNAYFMFSVPVKGTYKYTWWKQGVANSLGSEEMLKLTNCQPIDAGQYYCKVINLDTRDTLTSAGADLEVLPVPTAEILLPTGGMAEICEGESITLSGNDVQSGETYNWMGYDFVKDRTSQDVEVRPTGDTTLYVLIVNNGVCRMMDSVTIVVRKVRVDIPDVLNISKGEQATFTLSAEAGVTYDWSTNKGHSLNNNSTFSFTPNQRTLAKVVRTEGPGCWASDSCLVYVKEFGVGTNPTLQNDDGFTETDWPFTIVSSEVSPIVCATGMANMNVEVGGSGVYRFAWKKINGPNDTVQVSADQHYVMMNVPLDAAGKYFCEVTDVKTKQKLHTLIYEMKVLEYPIAMIESPRENTQICLGETLTLSAYTGNADVTYLWEGMNITGDYESVLSTAKPEESGTYALTVNNGYCKATAYVDVVVKKTLFDLEEVRYVTAGEEVTFAPTLPAGAQVNWKYSGGAIDALVFRHAFEQSDLVVATATYDDCPSVDSVRIYVKSVRTYMGGDGDGFIELEMPFTSINIDGNSTVCEHTDAEFSVRVVGSGLYSYKWYNKATGAVVSRERILTIRDCQLAQNGEIYYCIVEDQLKGQKINSDEILLKVLKTPQVVINLPARGSQICYGQAIRIDARGTEASKSNPTDEFKYYWDGENVQVTEREYVVDVRPTKTQVYTLKVAYKECAAFDTLTIRVGRPIVELPAYKIVNEGDNVSLTATVKNVSTGAKINWWNNGSYYPNRNPFEFIAKESTVVRAEVEEKGCIGKDSTFVYPRCVAAFRGGQDDGFMESCDVPFINKGAEKVLGCGGADSVVLKVDYSGNGVKAQWQFYNKNTDMFEELASASNLSGVAGPTLTIKPVLESNIGLYRCRLENDCAPVYSEIYTVTKDKAPILEGVSLDTVEYCEGAKDVQLSTAIKNSDSDISYRWYKQNTKTGVKEQLQPEAAYNQPGMIIKQVGLAADALYIVEAENACGTTSDSIRMLITGMLAIDSYTGDSGEHIVCNGSEVNLKMLVAGGGAGRSYRLSKILPNGSKTVISESGLSDYTFTNITKADSGRYVWKVLSVCKDSVESTPFLLNVENPPVFTRQARDTTACVGSIFTLEVKATVPGSPKSKIVYRWEKQDQGILFGSSEKYVINPFNAMAAGTYLCFISNSCDDVASDPIRVAVQPEVKIMTNPRDTIVCEDKPVAFSCQVNLPAAVDSIRWFCWTPSGEKKMVDDHVNVSGTTTYRLTLNQARMSDVAYYRCVVYYACGSVSSARASLTVNERPKIIAKISEGPNVKSRVCQGTEQTLTVVATGKEQLRYSWYINDEVVPDANKSSLTMRFDTTVTCVCMVQNYCNAVRDTFTVTVVPAVIYKLTGEADNHYCVNKPGIMLSLPATDTNYVYSLYRDDNLVDNYSGWLVTPKGGALAFGYYKKGVYTVWGEDVKNKCTFQMSGKIQVLEDTLTPAFDLKIKTPVCQRGNLGEIVLTKSIKRRDNSVEYTLYKPNGAGEWIPAGLSQPGTGGELIWSNIALGTYRVKAIDHLAGTGMSGCEVWMNGEVTLQERDAPAICKLYAVGGDTVYCDQNPSHVTLALKDECAVDGMTYTLIKDNTLLTDSVDKVKPISWTGLTEGVYSVEIKNQWGCTVNTNTVTVVEKSVPLKMIFSGGGCFCDKEVGTKNLILTKGIKNVKYEIFTTGNKLIHSQYGEDQTIQVPVPNTDATYYAMATDTATGCSVEMTGRPSVVASIMKVTSLPVAIELNFGFASAQFDLTVTDAVKTPIVTWEPAGILQAQDGDWLHPTLFWMANMPKVYTATVNDGCCNIQHPVHITVTGEVLSAEITTEALTPIPKDTVWVCENDPYVLDAIVDGGTGYDYHFKWTQNGKTLSDSKLSKLNTVASTSGYVVLTTTNVLLKVKDSVWLEVYPAPGKDLVLKNSGENCVGLGDQIQMRLGNAQPGTNYSLEFSFSEDGMYNSCGSSKNPPVAGDITLERPFDNLNKAGYYRVKAYKEYGVAPDLKGCTSFYKGIHVKEGTPLTFIDGGGQYCQRSDDDTIRVYHSVKGSFYRLLYKPETGRSYSTVAGVEKQEGTDGELKFIGKRQDGYYRVVAERSVTGCVDTMNGIDTIKHYPLPAIGQLIVDDTLYCKSQGLNVQIGITNCVSTNSYTLYRATKPGERIQQARVTGQTGDVVFAANNNDAGLYFVVADDGHCENIRGNVRIANTPIKATLHVADTGYCIDKPALEMKAKLYDVADYAVIYDLCKQETGTVMGSFGSWKDDTVYFKGNVEAGNYIIKPRAAAACAVDIPDVIQVITYPLPAKKDILKPNMACVGTELTAGVRSSDLNVVYELFKKVEDAPSQSMEMLPGDGNPLTFTNKITAEGDYYIAATSDNTGCVQELGNYTMSPQPVMYDMIAVDTAYCEYRETDGAQLGLNGSEAGIEYFLQQYNDEKNAFDDVRDVPSLVGLGTNEKIFFTGKYKAGHYRIRTNVCDSACMSGEIFVLAKKLPVDTMLIEIAGNACIDSTFQLVIKPTENNTNYTLLKDENNYGTKLIGDGTQQSWAFNDLEAGTYIIQAEKDGCIRDLERKITVSTLYPVTNLKGVNRLCEFNKTELKLSTFSNGIDYYIADSRTGVKVVDGKAKGSEMVFSNVPVGAFYAVSKNGDCKGRSSIFTINPIKAPKIENVKVSYTDCKLVAGEGKITISDMVDTLIYSLILPDKSTQSLTANNGETKEFERLSFGAYTFKVQGVTNTCPSRDSLITLRQGIPVGDTLMVPRGYCAGTLGAKLQLANATTDIRYVIFDKNGLGVDSLFNQGKLFKNTFRAEAGPYTIKRTRERYLGGCSETTSFDVKEYIYPAADEKITVTGDPLMCAGTEYEITVKDALADVAYILQRDGVSVDTVWGAGNVSFDKVKKNGYYKILPKGGSICGTLLLDTVVVIKALPQAVNAMDCQYCVGLDGSGDTGCSIDIYGATKNVKYILSDRTNFIDTVKADITTPYICFEKKTVGKYDIWALDTVTGCQTIVDSAEITRGQQPIRFLVGADGGRCGIEVEVATVDGSQSDTVEYYLYRDGTRIAGPKKTLESANVIFGLQRNYGVYKIYAQKTSNGCGVFMKDSIVIAPALLRDTLERRGTYCENVPGSDILFYMYHPQNGWKYTVSQEKEGNLIAAGDTIKGVGGSGILWKKIGTTPIRGGQYVLYAVNGCAEAFPMDTIVVDTNRAPKVQKLTWQGGQVCLGNKQEFVLEASETTAEYELFLNDSETNTSLVKMKGTGLALKLGEFDREGTYVVIGRNIKTACFDTMDKVKMVVIRGIDDPGVTSLTGGSICLSDPSAQLVVKLKQKSLSDPVNYYLRKTLGDQELYVDSIKYTIENLYKTEFQGQNTVGQYDVIAKRGTCESVFPGYKVGAPPTVYDVTPLAASVCIGRKVGIILSNSEIGVDYEVCYIQHNGLDTDTLSTGVITKGVGTNLPISVYDSVRTSGVYVVKADNGCSAVMKDSAVIQIKQPLPIALEKEYVKCVGDTVRIEVKGVTVQHAGSIYCLYEPGMPTNGLGSAQHMVNPTGDGGSFTFNFPCTKPGYYRVLSMEVQSCPVLDSVLVKFTALPNKYAISTEPNEYICNQQAHAIVLSHAQADITYTLFKKNGTDLQSKGSKNWDGLNPVKFNVTEAGRYVVQAKATGTALGCTQWMDGEVALVSSDEIRQIQLVGVVDKYCEVPGVMPTGKVKLSSSDPEAEYQLYKDGVPYDNNWYAGTAAHDPIVWDNLPGGMPRMTAEQTKVGTVYTVKARSIVSRCEQEMIGAVTVIAERRILFDDDHFDKVIPKCIGGTLQLLLQAYGGQITYTWQKDGSEIATGLDNFYLKQNIQNEDNGLYRCIVSNTCGKDTTRTVSIVPGLLIDKEADLADQTVCDLGVTEERKVRLQSAIKNAVKYTWTKDGRVLDDKKDLWLDITVSHNQGTGMYICTAANECGTLSDTSYVKIDSTPRITPKQLVHDTLCLGAPYSLNVRSNFPATWFRGTANTGQIGTTLNIVAVKPEDEGLYKAVVKNACGESTAEIGQLLVDTLLHEETLTNSPVKVSACEDASLNLIFHTTQTERVSYLWTDHLGKELGRKNLLENFNVKSYTQDNVELTVTAKNKCGALTKAHRVQILRSLRFEEPVEMIKLCVNSGAADTTIRVKVLNDHPDNLANYNWMFYSVKKEEMIDLKVYTPDLKIPLKMDNFGYYYCGISNTCGDTTTRTVFVRLDTVPEITTNLPTTMDVCGNNPLTLKLGAKGGAFTYKWYVQKHNETVPKQVFKEDKNTKISESTWTFTPDTSYRGAIVTCQVENSCSSIPSVAMRLNVWDPIEFSVTSSAAVLCQSTETKLYISAKNAAAPWQYKYRHNDQETASAMLSKDKDTLSVREGGTYEFIYLKDNRGCTSKGVLALVNLQEVKVSDVTLSLVGDRPTVCADSTVQLKLAMTGQAVGPWSVEIRRSSDGQLATEIGFVNAIQMTKPDTVFTFKLSRTEAYYARVRNIYTSPDATCEANNTSDDPILLSVVEPPQITANELTEEQKIFSKCATINLQNLFNVQIVDGDGKTGTYLADGIPCAGNWWLDLKASEVKIKYRIWDMGCATEQELGTLSIKDKPKANIWTDYTHLCPGTGSEVKITGQGVYNLNIGYTVTLFDRNGGKTLVESPDNSFRVKDTLTIPVAYQKDLEKVIYKITRVEDKLHCSAESLEGLSDTIHFEKTPKFEVTTRSSKEDWKTLEWQYLIMATDSVEINVKMLSGSKPWFMGYERSPHLDPIMLSGLNDTEKRVALKKEGFYSFTLGDKYCTADTAIQYLVKVMDTTRLTLTALLEGPYDPGSGKMLSSTATYNLLKDIRPGVWPVLAKKIIDWVDVELWKVPVKANEKPTLFTTQACLILEDGTVVDAQGKEKLTFLTDTCKYYVALRHRNHLAVMSKAQKLSKNTSIDFRGDPIYLKEGSQFDHMSQNARGQWMLSAGEFDKLRVISAYEPNKTAKEALSITQNSQPVTKALLDLDVNFDGLIDWPGFGVNASNSVADWAIVWKNRNGAQGKGRYSEVPNK